MICKIQYYPKDGEKAREHVFDCTDFYLNYVDGNKIDVFTAPETIIGEIDPESTEIYLMNDVGKTIASYRWKIMDGKIKVH